MVCNNSNNIPYMMVVLWIVRERQYFVSTILTIFLGTPHLLVRMRRTEDGEDQFMLKIPQPELYEPYYSSCSKKKK